MVPTKLPVAKAMAWAAPHTPMRMPSRFCVPLPASPIMELMAATVKAPVATPIRMTFSFRGQTPGIWLPSDRPARVRADRKQPMMVQRFSAPGEPPPSRRRLARKPTRIMPTSAPECWLAVRLVDSPTVKPKAAPAKGSRIRSCML